MIDCWAGEPPPLIICEARSTKGVLERIVRECLAPITATGGQSGGFIVNDIVLLLPNFAKHYKYLQLRKMPANDRCYEEL
jgi:hypothetical protein